MSSKGTKPKPGPQPETLRAEGADWTEAVRHALTKPRPPEGWPETNRKKKPAKKK